MFLSDRESRGIIAVILATAAVIIGINLVLSPDGLPAWAAVAAILCAALAAGLWLWSWREQVTPNAPYKTEAEPIVTLAAAPEPVALPAPVAAAPEAVVMPEPEPVVPSEVAAATATPAPDQVVQAVTADPTPAIQPDVVETEVELPTAPTPEPEEVVTSVAPTEAPEETAAEIQDETGVQDETAAPETQPEPGTPAEEPAAAPAPESLGEASPVPPTATAYKPGESDDLTRIEGIGPYYRDALAKLGITTFSQLASRTDAAAMVAELKANGYRQHPTIPTWAEQAALAAAGDWEGLAKLQASLIGGRRGGD
ncbi:MAG: hypothetical protein MUF38_18810, partial [Anaerolineae bacterium]|jgi:predicted flap endonuclease-1-like 5' DNA nuclease|nr:hypothetical protein [Anaerolineae bacterium]